MNHASSKTVCFRLSALEWQSLATEAGKRRLSPGDYARQLVLSMLTGAENSELLGAVGELQEMVHLLSVNIERSVVAILADGGKCDARDAETWVKDNLAHAHAD